VIEAEGKGYQARRQAAMAQCPSVAAVARRSGSRRRAIAIVPWPCTDGITIRER
jgi:hypothetical protein